MLNKSPDHKVNYLATIVKLDNVRKLPNSDMLQCVSIMGNNVITGLDAKDGMLYCYFPVESAINPQFLKFTNSFEDASLNDDTTIKGKFGSHGRVRCIRLRQQRSEGYIVPVSVLEQFSEKVIGKKIKIDSSFDKVDFDSIHDCILLKKYVSRKNLQASSNVSKKTKGNVKRYASKLVEGQFNFHQDTAHLKKFISNINPDDYISITEKLHGCNFIVSNVLVKKQITLKERIAKFFGIAVPDTEYGMLYSSRAVIKNHVFNDGKLNNNYYDSDVWKIVADKIFPSLKEGISVTGEIVGFTPTGAPIQKGYDYGCDKNQLDFWIFKVTYTSPKGDVYTFSHQQTVDFCKKYGFKMPKTHFYGKASDLYPDISTDNHWHENILDRMCVDYLEKKCIICKNDVPNEGIILRRDIPHEWEVFKLKSFSFLERETKQLDTGEIDLETSQTV